MDVIDDVDMALEAYLAAEFPSDIGEMYLWTYGVLQALFVQQDALRHLIDIISPSVRVELSDVLKEIRDLRSASIGHPTEFKRKGEKSVHAINRSTLAKNGFQMLSFGEKNGTSLKNVPVSALIANQRKEATRILLEVVKKLEEEDRMHREHFRETKLGQAFNQVLYAFEKIFEDLRGNRQTTMGAWGANHLQCSLDQFESLIKARGMNLETYDPIKYRYDETKYPLGELTKYFESRESDILKRETAVVFAEALHGHFAELMDIAGEIDQDYESTQSQ